MVDTNNILTIEEELLWPVVSETSDGDKLTILAVQEMMPSGYRYVEVGSHIGGTIAPHLLSRECDHVLSIDPRPPRQDDERGRVFEYPDNTTGRMLLTLVRACGDERVNRKLGVREETATEVSSSADWPGSRRYDMALIDAEHTFLAVARDFIAVERMMERDAVVLVHDSNILVEACLAIELFADRLRPGKSKVAFLKDNVFAVGFGARALDIMRIEAGPRGHTRTEFVERSRAWLSNERTKNAQQGSTRRR